MKPLFTNNTLAKVATPTLSSTATTIILETGTGDQFPAPAAGQYALLTLFEIAPAGTEVSFEIVKLTNRVADNLTVERNFEPMAGAPHAYPTVNNGSTAIYVGLRMTSHSANRFLFQEENLNDLTDKAVARQNLGVKIGEDVQSFSAKLAALAALTWAADRIIALTGAASAAVVATKAYGLSLLDTTNAAAARTLLELEKGVGAGQIPVLDNSGRLPAVDGSLLTGVSTGSPVVQVSANTTLTAASHRGKIVETITNNALTHTLPTGTAMPNGGIIEFLSQTIGNTVVANGGDLIKCGNENLTSAALNPGTALRFIWTGTEWRLDICPSRGFLHNYTGGDIALNRGETCHYDISGSTSLLLRIATQDKHLYEIDWGSSVTPASSSQTWSLRLNNTSYASTVSVGFLYSSLNGQGAVGNVGPGNSEMLLTPASVGTHYSFRSTVHCKTALKQVVTQFRSLSSSGFMGLVDSASTDTTTLWTSLGTLSFGADTPQGRVTVRRIA